jgi:putative Mg2+ transporter-C (MgtC) family protein
MNNEVIYRLLLSVVLGSLLGLERKYKEREAGPQTYSLVALGTCLFAIVALEMNKVFPGSFDVLRIIQAVAIGIGFIGGGVIFRQSSGVIGLTTAAGLWVASAVGIAVGFELYSIAVLATFLSLIVFIGFGFLEVKVFKRD